MESKEIRKKFLEFFEKRGHTIVPSSSLIPDDSSVLLTTAGMQQFKPYYIGKADAMKDFGALSTTSVQKSFRTSDIDEVGDESHLTFFEMLGNFSFGGYWKEKAIKLAWEFLTNQKDGLGISSTRIHVTIQESVPLGRDEESYMIWKKEIGLSEDKIKTGGIEDNFWGPTGANGPCGPTTEIYIDGVEVWNIVFNQYFSNKNREASLKTGWELKDLLMQGIDTGMGFERLAMVLQNKKNIFETDLFVPLFELLPKEMSERDKRIVADHLRGAVFLLADGVRPSNKDRGYVLRRLMRRTMGYEHLYKIPAHVFDAIVHGIVHDYGEFYPELLKNNKVVRQEIQDERVRFHQTAKEAIKEEDRLIDQKIQEELVKRGFNNDNKEKKSLFVLIAELKKDKKIELPPLRPGESSKKIITIDELMNATTISGKEAFDLYQSKGASLDLIAQVAQRFGLKVDKDGFLDEAKKHQEISRSGQEKKFGGHGLLLDTGELKAADEAELKKVTRLHTATHLLNAALRKVLHDQNIRQDGSDITAERTRFDFTFSRKLTEEEIKQIEDMINEVVAKNMDVVREEMAYQDAVTSGALHFFKEKYPERVSVYTVRDAKTGEVFSKELCGGPHVAYTGEIGHVKIIKEESSSAGVRRIRATVE